MRPWDSYMFTHTHEIKRQKTVITFTVRQKEKREREGGTSASKTFLLQRKVGHETTGG